MSTSREELLALAERIASVSWKASYTGIVLLGHERDMIVSALRLAATPKAGVDHTPTSNLVVHPDIAEALSQACEYFENRADVVDGDYGVPEPNTEMRLAQMCSDALDRISILPSVLGGVDQPRIATKPSPSRAEDSATETGCLRSVGWLTDPNDSDAPKFFGAVVEYKNGCFPKLPMTAVWDGTPVRITALPQTDTPPPDNAGLVSGGGK